ncbi:MAG: hypothetical protein AMJ54_08905 [Deltaproteobacteria bacterium SG8_13]|nr:MAG: hypothetical protein AMJ54_08905 [Deltaproteobacteria bacterium SG8_13]
MGVFPVLGTTTILCAVAALLFRLNLPLIQLVNYAVYPLQIILLGPFYAAGSWLFGSRLPVEFGRQLIASMQTDLWESLLQLGSLTLYAISAWLLISPAIVLSLWGLSKPALGKVQSVVQKAQHPRKLSKNRS